MVIGVRQGNRNKVHICDSQCLWLVNHLSIFRALYTNSNNFVVFGLKADRQCLSDVDLVIHDKDI